jgi:asparagine synthetase B (glutamine-hydrolysing)
MCGILLVKSQREISLDKHLSAFRILQSRGPDFNRFQYKNNIFIGQTVLHITGTDEYYNNPPDNFLAYNGEVYNYQELGAYQNDIEFVHDCVENNIVGLKKGWGPWAWAWTDDKTVLYASDPQGERCLYHYQDEEILIVCSEVAPILTYMQVEKISQSYQTKHWCMLFDTPWRDISRIEPGQLYQDGKIIKKIDSIFDWITSISYNNIDEAYEEFQSIWSRVTTAMIPACPAALTYSGGLDSSIILNSIPDLELYAVNNFGKDPIVDCIRKFLTLEEQTRLHELIVDQQQWAGYFNQILDRLKMPVQSWSFVGQWIVSQQCKQRVLFTGVGADELFGGYDVYSQLNFCLASASPSPYSTNSNIQLWQKCLEIYNYNVVQASLLMDYWHQIVGCDAQGIDAIAGAWGIETRNPFLAKPIMQFALNLPHDFKVGHTSKPLIRRLFLERWSQDLILPKKGFTGHCNDSLPWLGINVSPTGNRAQDWKTIVQASFYNYPN